MELLLFCALFALLIPLTFQKIDIGLRCDMIPEGVTAPKLTENIISKYKIEISGNPDSYIPGEQYTIFLRSSNAAETVESSNNKFTHFILSVTNENPEKNIDSESAIGSLQLYGDTSTKFSDSCQNAVIEADQQLKYEIQFLWIAPSKGSGCVKFRATVVESVDIWYSEDGDLTKIFCEESPDTEDTQPKILKHCCTCDEAKYEVTFEGLWSRNTHPKDFPMNGRITRFSDIIGASHTVNYSFWNYGDYASEGLQQLAEYGNTRLLESELKAKSEHIRTIIKARGVSFPNITGKTFAVFRVDNKHHLMSIVSMIDPSPDWIVGVSGLELCLRNCSWIESKILNLYPWDVGTDDGITYLSVNQPAGTKQPIRRLKFDYPDDPRSPFYDPTGMHIKPFAKLKLTRQRLYEKSCDFPENSDLEDNNSNCETTEWSPWSTCSVTCGKGVKYKQRTFKNEESKYICHKKLTERATCEAQQKYCPKIRRRDEEDEDPLCELSPWSSWSTCSVSCGKGTKTRDRKFKSRFAAKRCVLGRTRPLILQQNLECVVETKCEEYKESYDFNDCPERPWSDWSPCSATCDKGFKERYKLSLKYTGYEAIYGRKTDKNEDVEEEEETDSSCERRIRETVECFDRPSCEKETNNKLLPNAAVCSLPKDVGACKSNIDRWFFNMANGQCEIFSYSGCEGNQNNFNTLELCQTLCSKFHNELMANSSSAKVKLLNISGILSYNIQNDANNVYRIGENFGKILRLENAKIDCKLSKWTQWTKCVPSDADCGFGFKLKYRHVEIAPRNGGIPCSASKRMMKKRRCFVEC